MILKKLLWTFKRHPFLYTTRFKLLSKNSDINEIEAYDYNLVNKKEDIPKCFYKINDLIFGNGIPATDLELVKRLAEWLITHIKGGSGLSVPSDEALKIMLNGEGGVCSDMAQIFNNFCVINDIKVREWGCTRAPFEKEYGGHSYNEVYIKELKKWVLMDVSYGLMFYKDTTPLSVTEFYQLFREGKSIQYSSFINSVKQLENSVHRNYMNPNTVPFLICNYQNKVYDRYLKLGRPFIPVFIIHFLIFIFGKSYHYKFPIDEYKNILP